jgi:transposase
MTYSVRDIQERYGVSQSTVLHWLRTQQLKYLNVGRDSGKRRARYRITEAQLMEFELSRTTTLPIPRTHRRKKQKQDDIERVYGGW